MAVDYVPVTDPANEAESRARILAIQARQRASAEAHAARLAEEKAARDAAARLALTAAAEQAVRIVEVRAQRRKDQATAEVEASRDPRCILARISAEFGVLVRDIDGPSRKMSVLRARFAAIHAIREANPHFSLSRIGQCIGGRDHSSVHNALRTMAREGVPQPATPANPRERRAGRQKRDACGRFARRRGITAAAYSEAPGGGASA